MDKIQMAMGRLLYYDKELLDEKHDIEINKDIYLNNYRQYETQKKSKW